MRKGGWDSSSFSLFRKAIHSRISRETAAKAVIAMSMVFIMCFRPVRVLTSIYIEPESI